MVWYPKKQADLKIMHNENNVITDDKFVIVRKLLSTSEHACLCIQNVHPRRFNVSNHVQNKDEQNNTKV